MTFKDDMIDDMDVFINDDEFGQTATYLPRAKAAGTGNMFAINVTFGDPDPNVLMVQAGQVTERTARILVSLADVRAGLLAVESAARDPVRGDRIVIASGADAGTWVVQDSVPDIGGGCQLNCRLADQRTYGAEGATVVR